MPNSRAWASFERSVWPYQAPGKTMSSVYSAVPFSLAGPSRRSGSARARPTLVSPSCGARTGESTSSTSGKLVRGGRVVTVTLPMVTPEGRESWFAE